MGSIERDYRGLPKTAFRQPRKRHTQSAAIQILEQNPQENRDLSKLRPAYRRLVN
jgi:hypothetical protein